MRTIVGAALGITLIQALLASTADAVEAPPPVPREFRAVWVATVSNIDWPSRPGLSTEKQKSELLAILDKAVELNLNAIILQVRPAADAFYPSKLEPWSPYLTGQMGKPPEPFYDPLEFAVEEAHRRGLQLHVWFNPYRVQLEGGQGKASPDHASIAKKNLVRQYGKMLWFDPGEPKAGDHFIAVLNDVVKRYDIDGVHIDDYFYPYQVTDAAGKVVPFPDEESYERAMRRGRPLERDDWRRQNVNHLIERMYEEVKRAKPWVQVGISPFGIWRPGHPPGITGLDQYNTLYADARLWFQQGWLDYMTPQLYWEIDSKGQSYPKLLAWWVEQNAHGRHLWPGNFTSKWPAEEIVRQIEATRAQPGATGNIHFSMKAIMKNQGGVAELLKERVYAEPALVPESPWLDKERLAKPQVSANQDGGDVLVEMKLPRGREPRQWLVQVHAGDEWTNAIVPGQENQHTVSLPGGGTAEEVVVSAVSRLGKLSPPARTQIKTGN